MKYCSVIVLVGLIVCLATTRAGKEEDCGTTTVDEAECVDKAKDDRARAQECGLCQENFFLGTTCVSYSDLLSTSQTGSSKDKKKSKTKEKDCGCDK